MNDKLKEQMMEKSKEYQEGAYGESESWNDDFNEGFAACHNILANQLTITEKAEMLADMKKLVEACKMVEKLDCFAGVPPKGEDWVRYYSMQAPIKIREAIKVWRDKYGQL